MQTASIPGISFSHFHAGGRSGANAKIQADSVEFNPLNVQLLMDDDFFDDDDFGADDIDEINDAAFVDSFDDDEDENDLPLTDEEEIFGDEEDSEEDL